MTKKITISYNFKKNCYFLVQWLQVELNLNTIKHQKASHIHDFEHDMHCRIKTLNINIPFPSVEGLGFSSKWSSQTYEIKKSRPKFKIDPPSFSCRRLDRKKFLRCVEWLLPWLCQFNTSSLFVILPRTFPFCHRLLLNTIGCRRHANNRIPTCRVWK